MLFFLEGDQLELRADSNDSYKKGVTRVSRRGIEYLGCVYHPGVMVVTRIPLGHAMKFFDIAKFEFVRAGKRLLSLLLRQ